MSWAIRPDRESVKVSRIHEPPVGKGDLDPALANIHYRTGPTMAAEEMTPAAFADEWIGPTADRGKRCRRESGLMELVVAERADEHRDPEMQCLHYGFLSRIRG